MRPLHDKVLVERRKKEESKGKILIVDESKENNEFNVLALGKGVTIDIKVGDKVLIDVYGTNLVPNKEKRELYIANQNSIYMVVE